MSKQKSKVFCEKPEDPPFIRRLKEKIGFQAGPTVDTKKEVLPKDPVNDNEEEGEAEEELPTIVVLKAGDLNEDEVKAIREQEDLSKPKKIVFKKPDKSKEKKSDLVVSSSKRAAEEERAEQLIKKHASEKDKAIVKKTNLLSFGDDDEEDE